MEKPRLRASSAKWICEIDNHIRSCNIRGPVERFRDAASDALDGYALRSELDDLIRRGFLTVCRYGFDDSMGRDINRDRDPKMCGTSWTVDTTPKLIRTFWPDRLHARSRNGRFRPAT